MIKEIEYSKYDSVIEANMKQKLNELIKDYNKKVGVEDGN